MVRPADATLHQRPEAFDGVRVNVTDDVDVGGVVDALVLVPVLLGNPNVGVRLVGVDDGTVEHAGFDVRPRVWP